MTRSDRCYWCSCETLSPKKVGPTCPNLATVDHIRSKPECLSKKEYNDPGNKVNACFACNQRRSTDWCRRRDAGLVHPTGWSIQQAEKNRRRELRKRERLRAYEPAPDFAAAHMSQRQVDIFAPPSWELLAP